MKKEKEKEKESIQVVDAYGNNKFLTIRKERLPGERKSYNNDLSWPEGWEEKIKLAQISLHEKSKDKEEKYNAKRRDTKKSYRN